MSASENVTVLLGNVSPLMADGSAAGIGNTITTVTMREGWDDADEVTLALSTGNDPALNTIDKLLSDDDKHYAIGLLEIVSLWNGTHSGDNPEWVESDDPEFARVVAEYFSSSHTEVPVGQPDNYEMSDAVRASLLPPVGGGSMPWEHFSDEFSEHFQSAWREHNLLTTVGRDALHSQHLNTAAQPAAFNYMAVSANVTAPSAASTTLPGEITTAGGGLLRAQATYAHTASTNTTTLTKTFTANGSDALPVTIGKIGVLNAASVGTLGYETLLNATATLTTSGDNVAITHTITAG